MSSHYSHRQGQLVTNQLTSGQNLPLPCVDTFGVQYDVVNAIATLAYGESIRIGDAFAPTLCSLQAYSWLLQKW